MNAIRRSLLSWLKGENTAKEPIDDAASVSPQSPQLILTNRFEDLGEIGRGSMASVRKVRDCNLLRTVAMKLLDPRIARQKGELERFIEEAQITGQLEHPNIPAVHERGVDEEGTHYFSMKYVRGSTLEHILLEKGFSIENERHLFSALQVFVKVCQAVGFAHSQGVIHCDLKPANVMVGSHGQVYVMDWGIARLRAKSRPSGADSHLPSVNLQGGSRRDDQGKIIGSLSYMSPEQASGMNAELDERSDIFSLGAILYRILTGRPPYKHPTADGLLALATDGRWLPPQEICPSIALPPRLCNIVMKAMAKDSRSRYSSAAALQDDIEQFMSGPGRLLVRTFLKGELIIREGEPGDSAFIISKGKGLVFRTVRGRRRIIHEMGPGDIFGEMALLTSAPRMASVEAVEDVEAHVLNAATLGQELGQTVFTKRLLNALAERFREVDKQASFDREELINVRAREMVFRHIALSGRRSKNRCTAPWPPLCKELTKELAQNRTEALELISRIPGIQINTERDEISLERA